MKPFAPSLHSPAPNGAAAWQPIVHDGARKDQGMIAFAPVMRAAEIEAIRLYVIKRANEDKALVDKGQGTDVE